MIANDGGPLHIAASQQVPTVSIFGPVDPDVYGPYPPSPRHQVVYHEALPCRPCYHQFKLPPCPYERACLTGIEPRDVLEACERILMTPETLHDRIALPAYMVMQLLGLSEPPKPADCADAAAIALCHLHRCNVHASLMAVTR